MLLIANLFRQDNTLQPFAVKLAEAGHTYQYLKFGYSEAVSRATKQAVQDKNGLRGLPRRTWKSPFKPFEIRKEWRDPTKIPAVYEQYYETCVQELAICNEDIKDAINDYRQSRFYVRLVRSALSNEGLCYFAKSSIPGAGMGLFLIPRKNSIAQGKRCIQTS